MKQKTLIIAGQHYAVNFGVNYFYRYFLEATGVDLIQNGLIDLKSIKIFDYLAGFLYAGCKAECSMKDVECTIAYKDADRIVMSITEQQASDLFIECAALMNGMESEDLKNATAQAAKKNGTVKVKARG